MSAQAAADRVVQGALERTPEGLRSAVEMAGQVIRIVEGDTAYDESERAMALLAIYGIVHRALIGIAAGNPPTVTETGHAPQTH